MPFTVILAFLPQRCPEPFAMANRYLPVWDFPGGSGIKNLPAHAGDLGLIPGWGRSPERGNGNPLQCSCLGNPMDRGAWWGTVHGVARSWTQLSAHTLIHRSILFNTAVLSRYLKVSVVKWKLNFCLYWRNQTYTEYTVCVYVMCVSLCC